MWFSRAKHLLRQLFRRGTIDHDLDDEVASYYGILSDQGRPRVDSDGPTQVKFNVRESRMSAPIDTITQDLVYAARVLKKSPGFTFFAVLLIACAIALAQYIQAMLFNTSPLDPWNLAAVSALFLAVAMAACFVPAWRAAQVDPITALRQE